MSATTSGTASVICVEGTGPGTSSPASFAEPQHLDGGMTSSVTGNGSSSWSIGKGPSATRGFLPNSPARTIDWFATYEEATTKNTKASHPRDRFDWRPLFQKRVEHTFANEGVTARAVPQKTAVLRALRVLRGRFPVSDAFR